MDGTAPRDDRRRLRRRGRRGSGRRPPEVLQTSAMDCGPAAVAALLGAHGLHANVDALRAVCATDVDGTSVDDLEEVALALGVDAEQIVVPLDQVLACPEVHLPALVLMLTPDGYVHFVTAWRVRRRHVDIVDPAIGHRAVPIAAFRAQALAHELVVAEQDWAEYALGDEAADALEARLRRRGTASVQAHARVARARADGPVTGIGALLDELAPDLAPVVTPCGTDEDGDALVRVRAAVLVRAPRRTTTAEPPEEVRAVLAAPATTIPDELRLLTGLARAPIAIALGLAALAGLLAVAELVVARHMIDAGATRDRLLVLLGMLLAGLVAGAGSRHAAFAAGRRIERDFRERLLDRIARLGDAYARSRPTGDLAERAHGTVHLRAGVDLAARLVGALAIGVAGLVVLVVVAPSTWPGVVVLVTAMVALPWSLSRRLREPDLRARTMHGTLTLQLTDALGGTTGPGHRPVLRALHRPLLQLRDTAAGVVQRRLALGAAVADVVGLCVAGAMAWRAHATGESTATTLLVGVLGFEITNTIQQLVLVVRRWTPMRHALARLMEPLAVPLTDPAPATTALDGAVAGGAGIDFRDVTVRLGRSAVLDGVDLTLSPGEHVTIIGASGSGKSSLAAACLGWLRPSSGSILVDGVPLDGDALAGLRRATAWADASTRLDDASLTANADLGADAAAPPPGERLALLGLGPAVARLGDAPIGPGGARLGREERQRLRLARALGRRGARFVLLDEALSDITPHERRALLADRRRHWPHATIVNITHDIESVLDFDRVVVMDGGRVVEQGPPAALAADPGSATCRMLGEQDALHARIAAAERPAVTPAPDDTGAPVTADRTASPRTARTVVLPALGALLASAAAMVVLIAAFAALDSAARDAGPADGFGRVLVLLGVAGVLGGLAALGLGATTVALGGWTRRRALACAPSRSERGIGERVGLVLDLEHVESAVLGAGAMLSFAAVDGLIAVGTLVVLGRDAAAVAVVGGLVWLTVATARLARHGHAAATARAAVTAHLVDRLLSLRTVVMQEDPVRERRVRAARLDALERHQRRVDHRRVLLGSVVPRGTVAVVLVLLALDPPGTTAAAAGVLGAVLLTLNALERAGLAAAELAPAAGSVRGARTCLTLPSDPASTVPPKEQDAATTQLLHQPLAANALLGTGAWPPSGEDLGRLTELLARVELQDVVEAMPMGLGQPLGETGWRLSQGERARLLLIRELLAPATQLVLERPTASLDPGTAMAVLDLLDADPRVSVTHDDAASRAAGSPAPA